MINVLESTSKTTQLFITSRKRQFLIVVLATMSLGLSAQDNAEGTILLTTEDNQVLSVNVQATSTFDSGNNQYTLNGDTGTAMPFNDWALPTIGTVDFDIQKDILFGRTSKEFNAYLNVPIPKAEGRMYNKLGQEVGEITFDNNQFYFDGTQLSNDAYIARLLVNGQAIGKKIMLIGENGDGRPDTFGQKFSQSNTASKSMSFSEPNYNLTITGDEINTLNVSEELIQGNNTLSYTVIPQNGDFAIETLKEGSPVSNTNTTITNLDEPEYSYQQSIAGTQTVWENVRVESPTTPATYQVTIESNTGEFLTTTTTLDISQDIFGEVNGSKIVDVDPIPNVQDITTIIRDHENLNTLPGITINLYENDGDNDPTNDALLDSQVSDANGEVIFDNVPGQTPVYIVNTAPGYYTKTNGTYTTPLVDSLTEMDTTLNVVAVAKFDYEDATPVEASRITSYKPLADHTEFALDHWRIFFPPAAQRQTVIDHFDEVAVTLGNPGAIIDSDTPFPDPETNGTYETYQPYPANREVHLGIIGTNITNYSGTGTGRGEKTSILGENMTFYTLENSFNLGGLDWSDTDHEIGNALGFPLLTGTSSFQTSRDSSSPDNVAIINSKWDKAIMPLWLKLTKLHYDATDPQGRLIEYTMTKKFQE